MKTKTEFKFLGVTITIIGNLAFKIAVGVLLAAGFALFFASVWTVTVNLIERISG